MSYYIKRCFIDRVAAALSIINGTHLEETACFSSEMGRAETT